LGRLGGDAAKAYLRDFAQYLRDSNADVRVNCTLALLALAPESKDAAKGLEGLAKEAGTTKKNFWYRLPTLGPNILPTHVKLLEKEGEQKASAFAALSKYSKIRSDQVGLLTDLLDDPVESNRKHVYIALSKVEPDFRPAVPLLLRSYREKTLAVKTQVAAAIKERALKDKEAIKALVASLDDKDAGVRSQAMNVLASLGSAALPSLMEGLKSDNAGVRQMAIGALAKMGKDAQPAVPEVAKLLKDPEDGVRTEAMKFMQASGKDVLDLFIDQLKDEDAATRLAGAAGLAELGPKAAKGVPVLTAALADSDPRVRFQSLLALKEIGVASKPALPAIVKLLDEQDVEFRRGVIETIGIFGSDAKEALPALEKAIGDPDEVIRFSAFETLGKLGLPALPALTKALKDDNLEIRKRAAAAIGSMGAKAKEALPHLVALLKDADADLREAAVFAIKEFGPEGKPALPELVKLLKDPEPLPRIAAFQAVSSLGADAVSSIPVFIEALKSKDEDIAPAACDALAKIGEPSVKELGKLLDNSDKDIRRMSLETLTRIAPRDPSPVLQGVIARLQDSEEEVKIQAIIALGSFKSKAAPAIPPLKEILYKDKNEVARLSAIDTMAHIGKPATAALVEGLADVNKENRKAAIQAFSKMASVSAEAFAPIQALFVKDKDDLQMLRQATQALLLMGGPGFDFLAETIKTSPVKTLRLQIMNQIGARGRHAYKEPIIGTLTQLSADADADIARAASKALESIKPRK
jgi:HEAT repeat protein